MPFCSNCGNQLREDAKFCNSCGSPQVVESNLCPNCGKNLEENEKFCSSCGSPVKTETPPKTEPVEPKFTKEGKTIVGSGPKPQQNQQAQNIPPPVKQTKKKKRGCFGCFFRTLLILLILILVVTGFKFIRSKMNNSSGNFLSELKPGKEITSSVPDGAKIKKDDKPFESDELKKVLTELENVLDNGDPQKLKGLLAESALLKYEEELDKLKPQIKKYAEAFKKRKLVLSSDFYKVYEFSGDDGIKHTLTLEFQPGETWKITQL